MCWLEALHVMGGGRLGSQMTEEHTHLLQTHILAHPAGRAIILLLNHLLLKTNYRDVVPVPIPKYQNWYPYPSTHCGTRTRVSIWLGTRTRTHFIVHVPVPIPRYQYPSPYFSPAWYPYSYLRVGTRTRTHTYGLVPVPVSIPVLGTQLQLTNYNK